MSGPTQVEIVAEDAGMRLDRWLRRRYPSLTQGHLQKLLRGGQLRVNGGRAKANARLEVGQLVRVPPLSVEDKKPPLKARVDPETADLIRSRILYRDADVLALDKPAGLAVQGGSGQTRHLDGLLDALVFDGKERPRLVHRLDKDTSGVLLLARKASAARALTLAFRAKNAHKLYWAAVVGVPNPRRGVIDWPLSKKAGKGSERVRVDVAAGKKALSVYRIVQKAARRAAWLALEPRTGRTHQLRVHCAELGTPILGDGKYGGAGAFLDSDLISRKMHLHARAVSIPHPDGRRLLEVTAPLPEHMASTWDILGFDATMEAGFFDQV